jgi:hypothetical protein
MDETFSSWLERTACFYSCALDRWIGQFALDFSEFDADLDLDSSDELRSIVGNWSGISQARLPLPLPKSQSWLPNGARLAFCEYCWDEDPNAGRQPYVRRQWTRWTAVHCADHLAFLCAKNRSIAQNVAYFGWYDILASRPNWRMSFEIPGRPRTSGLWYRPSERLTNTTPPAELFTLLDRLNDHDDLSATDALASVLRTWTVKSGSYLQERIPVLLENRIEILKQAAFVLASSPSDSFRLSNRETAPISAQQSRD